MNRPALLALVLLSMSCSKKEAAPTGGPTDGPGAPQSSATEAQAAPSAPAGNPPPDGKYERVTVEGVTVPMIHVLDHGATVLVDTDGKKPRDWEEQYKRKRPALLAGQFDLHKTNVNKNDKFEDDPIDKEGLWIIDDKGNITKR
jgi:hypothetical protein